MLKKLFASATAMVMVVGSFAQGAIAAPAVTDPELIDAVSWAYDMGLTKYSNADAFLPYSNLTREQFAKFASQFASSVLGIEPDTSKTCSFNDESLADSSLLPFMIASCQQGIILGYQGNFMPKQLVTRGQVATVVSRMFGEIDPMSSEQAHFDYLNSRGIMKVASLSSSIFRGDALLMLYRAANDGDLCDVDSTLPGCSETPVDPVDPGEVVKQGSLNVSLNPSSPANNSSIPKVGSAKFATVDFTAGDKAISLFSVNLTRSGLGNYSDIDRVYFEKAGVRVSGKAAVSSDNTLTLSFAPALVVEAGKTVSLDLYADINGVAGGEHAFTSTAINSSAANVVGAFTTPTLRTADYTVSSTTFDAIPSSNTYQIDGKLVELGQFKVIAGARDSQFKAITLNNSGAVDLTDVEGFVLQRNGNTVSSEAIINGRNLTFVVNNDSILNGQIAQYSIKGVIKNVDRENDGIQLYLKNTSDLNVVESSTQFRTQVSINTNKTMGHYVIKGADVKLTTNTGFVTTVRAPQGASQIVLMSGSITSKTDVTLEDIKLLITPNGVAANSIAKKLTLTIGNSTFTHTTSGATSVYTGEFDGTVVIVAGQTLPVKLVADTIEYNAPTTGTLNISNLTNSSFGTVEYVSSGDPVTSMLGTVQGSILRITPTNLQVSNSLSAAQTVVLNASNVDVLAPKFSTSYDNPVRINQFEITLPAGNFTGTTWYLKDANGNVIANANNNSNKVSFTNLNITVTKNAPISTIVTLDNVPSTQPLGGVTLTATVTDAVDTATWTTVTGNAISKTLTVAASASVTATTASNDTRLVYAGQTAVAIGKVALKASNADATITKLNIDMTGNNISNFDAYKLDNLTLKDGSTTVAGSAIVNSPTSFTFDGLNYAIPAGQTKTFTVYADIPNLNTEAELSGSTFGLTLGASGTYTSANTELTIAGGQVMSSNIMVVKTKLVVSNPTKANGGMTPSMSFVLTPTAGNTVTVTGFTFNITPTNVSGATDVVVSSSPNGAGTIYATGAIAGPLNLVNELSVSSATTVYVTVKTITSWNPASASNPGSIAVTLSDFTYSDSVSDGDVQYPSIYANYVNELGANIGVTLTQ